MRTFFIVISRTASAPVTRQHERGLAQGKALIFWAVSSCPVVRALAQPFQGRLTVSTGFFLRVSNISLVETCLLFTFFRGVVFFAVRLCLA
jgi:hypothetical protein